MSAFPNPASAAPPFIVYATGHACVRYLLACIIILVTCLTPSRITAQVPASDQRVVDYHTLLDSALQATQVVYLGEQSHRDGATFTAKLRLIQYLHERHGFTVLAFEGDAFALDRWNTSLQREQATTAKFHDSLLRFWARATAVDSLAHYLLQQKGALRVAGFDNQLTTQVSQDSFVTALRQVLPEATLINYALLDELVRRLLRMDSFTDQDVTDVERLQLAVAAALEVSTLSTDRRTFWKMLFESLVEQITTSASESAGRPEPVQNARDRQLAHNLLYLTKQYPGRKIICWGASYHFAKDLSTLQLRDTTTGRHLQEMNTLMGHDSLPLAELLELEVAVPMAQVFAEISPLHTFSIAFTAGTGYTDQGHFGEDTLHLPVPAAPPGSWEDQFSERGGTESIHVFTTSDTLARHLAAMGYLPIKANWAAAFDAVYYTPRMYPVTYLSEISQESIDPMTVPPTGKIQGRVVDAVSREPVPYAYVYSYLGAEPLLSNLNGHFRGAAGMGDSLYVTAIGYATLATRRGTGVYALQPIVYATQEVLVRAGKIDPLQIVRAAATAVPFNYPQDVSQARFLWREVYTDSTKADTLDAILRIHDKIGYEARNWERVVSSRTARIDSLYHRSDWAEVRTGWDSYTVLDVFGHDPILANDRPLNPARFKYYTYRLLGTQMFAGKKVFVVAFSNNKPNSFTAGTTHLATHTGKLYINSDDFALVQYQESLAQRPYVFKERKTNNTIERSYQYSRRKGKYVLSLVRVANHYEVTTPTSDYERDQRKELYLLDWDESPTHPLDYPLMKLNRQPLRKETQWDSEGLFTTLK